MYIFILRFQDEYVNDFLLFLLYAKTFKGSYSWRLSQKHRGKEVYYLIEKVTWFQTSRFTAKEIWAAVEQSRKKPRSSVRDLLIRGYKLKLHKCGPVAFSETHFNMLSPMFIFSAFSLRDVFTTTVLAFKFLFQSMLRWILCWHLSTWYNSSAASGTWMISLHNYALLLLASTYFKPH